MFDLRPSLNQGLLGSKTRHVSNRVDFLFTHMWSRLLRMQERNTRKCDNFYGFKEYKTHLKDWYIAQFSNLHENLIYLSGFRAEQYTFLLDNIKDHQALETFKIYSTEITLLQLYKN
jgi:hypothetical protein